MALREIKPTEKNLNDSFLNFPKDGTASSILDAGKREFTTLSGGLGALGIDYFTDPS